MHGLPTHLVLKHIVDSDALCLDAIHNTKKVHDPRQIKNGSEQLETPFEQNDDPIYHKDD